tara:strand:+ start:216 stop:629 length:414 start_codon:yes stop_codon:yes gene_type:complete
MSIKKYLGNEVSMPYEQMIELRKSGKLNLGIDNAIALKIADKASFKKPKTIGAAMHFWNWIAIGCLVYSIYLSFTSFWWAFIPGIIIMSVIWNANKKGNSDNLLDEGQRNKEFYEQIRSLDGWMYEIDEDIFNQFKK